MDNRNIGIIASLLATFFWGTTFILVKKTVEIVPLDGFLTIRFLSATIIMLLITRFNKSVKLSKSKESLNHLKMGVILGILLYISYLFQTEGLTLTTPSKAAFITGMSVILISPIGFWFFKKIPTRMELFATFIAFVGLGLMTLNLNNINQINIGDLLIVVTAITVALHILIVDKLDDIDITKLITVQFGTISFLSFLLSIIRNSYWVPTSEQPVVWLTLIVTVVFASVFAFYAQIFAQRNGVTSTEIALIFMFEPIFALLIDVVLGSIPSLQIFSGMLLILFSMILAISKTQDIKIDAVNPII